MPEVAQVHGRLAGAVAAARSGVLAAAHVDVLEQHRGSNVVALLAVVQPQASVGHVLHHDPLQHQPTEGGLVVDPDALLQRSVAVDLAVVHAHVRGRVPDMPCRVVQRLGEVGDVEVDALVPLPNTCAALHAGLEHCAEQVAGVDAVAAVVREVTRAVGVVAVLAHDVQRGAAVEGCLQPCSRGD
jgi:hypothetical protein